MHQYQESAGGFWLLASKFPTQPTATRRSEPLRRERRPPVLPFPQTRSDGFRNTIDAAKRLYNEAFSSINENDGIIVCGKRNFFPGKNVSRAIPREG